VINPKELHQQVALLEADLKPRGREDPMLRAEWRAAGSAERTAAAFDAWLAERATQVAAGWVLGSVFVRFCEDNGLIEYPFITGRGDRGDLARNLQMEFFAEHPETDDRGWLEAAFETLSVSPAAASLFDKRHNPMWSILPSPHAIRALLDFWREKNSAGEVLYDFTDPEWNTRFLGDLYQDLSESARKTYALLQTPEFVEEFILRYTLDPAIEDFGLEPAPWDYLRVIDPVCGSGHFLLGAFRTLLSAWEKQTPAADKYVLVVKALKSIHGVDKNPFAVSIARFRLLLAAMKAAGVTRLTSRVDLPVNIAVGDSLLHGKGSPGKQAVLDFGNSPEHHTYHTEDVEDYIRSADILDARSYHVVIGNPPYLTPKDKAEAAAYKAAYPDSVGQYALTIPFIERFFQLGNEGYVGLLAANSFMKREFGRRLVERFLPTVDLTHVIDTSGVFIPGHGIPTAILLGRSRQPRRPTVEVVTNLRGEPAVPQEPAQGKVWQAIRFGVEHDPYQDEWIQAREIDREMLSSFPWNFGSETASKVHRKMERGTRLGNRTLRIGYYASTGSDEVFTAPPAYFRRIQVERARILPVITGSEVRDWQVLPHNEGAFFSEADKGTRLSDSFPVHMRRLWPYRTVLEQRSNYSGNSYLEDGRLWYSWHQVTETPDAHPWPIVFSWVSTHNHFAVLREKSAPLNSAPVIRVPSTASNSDIIQLAALLNSSLACFWLKQNSNSKGQPRADQTGTGEPWTLFYEFAGTRIADFPLPPDRWSGDRWSANAEQLDRLAQELAALTPGNLLKPGSMTLAALLDSARPRWKEAHAELVSLQEELDWEIYERYGLVSESDALSAPKGSAPGLAPGERAFEIVLARRVARGEISTTWFERNSIQPVTEVPAYWPASYRSAVLNRISLIERSSEISLIEQPEFKRRWQSDTWESMEQAALTAWLLDRCEDRGLWFDSDSPRPMTVNRLADRLRADADVVSVARFLKGEDADLADVLRDIIDAEHVPFLAQHRYKPSGLDKRRQWEEIWDLQRQEDTMGMRLPIPVPPKYTSADFLKITYWRHRGKLDVPKERFISYPGASPDSDKDSLLIGWAGWDHREQAAALIDLISEREGTDGWETDRLMGPLAGLLEIMPWVRQWHGDVIPEFGQSWAEACDTFLNSEREQRFLTEDVLRTWRPPAPRRGRPPKHS
jgi:hypothetical protein